MITSNPMTTLSAGNVEVMKEIELQLIDAVDVVEKREVVIIGVGTWNKPVSEAIYRFISLALDSQPSDKRILLATSYDKQSFSVYSKGKAGEMTDVLQLEQNRDTYIKTVELHYVKQIEELRKEYAKTIVIMDRFFTEDEKADGSPVSELYRYAVKNRYSSIINLPKLD